MLAVSAFPSYQPHPEVWLLTLCLAGLGIYVARVIEPKAVAAGYAPISTRQKLWFWFGLLLFWVATDYPMHDIAEERLYWVHMIQHTLLTMVVPPMMLLAVPTWLARLVIGKGVFKRFVYYWSKPMPAVIVFNLLAAFSHWAWVVNTSVEIGWIHYGLHTVLVLSAFLVWMSVCGPVPELQTAAPMKMVTLFLMSIIPTIPAAFLTVADGVLYTAYDQPIRLWGFTVINDQQLAGWMMKVGAGFYLWTVIAVIFFKWAFSERGAKRKFYGKLVDADGNIVDERDDESPKPGLTSL